MKLYHTHTRIGILAVLILGVLSLAAWDNHRLVAALFDDILANPWASWIRTNFLEHDSVFAQAVAAGSPGTVGNDASIGSVAWKNPGSAIGSDNVYATSTSTLEFSATNYLKATNFGFSIASGSAIDGLVVEVEGMRTVSSAGTVDNAVRIMKGGVIGIVDRSSAAPWPTADAIRSYGSPSDLWGEVWTPADINDIGFGVALSVQETLGIADTVQVDNIIVTVHYTPPPNNPPTADAGPNPTVVDADNSGAEDVSLEGSASFDTDGTIVSYEWTEGASVIATGVTPAPVSFTVGIHFVTLTVTDDDGATDSSAVVVTVDPFNIAPDAAAGSDQNVIDADNDGFESVTFDGSGSTDADGLIVTYEWIDEDGTLLGGGASPTVSLPVGSHTITLQVTDDDGATDTDVTFIKVIPLSSNNASQWAWSSGIGWLSFNSLDCDADGDGLSDGTPPGCPGLLPIVFDNAESIYCGSTSSCTLPAMTIAQGSGSGRLVVVGVTTEAASDVVDVAFDGVSGTEIEEIDFSPGDINGTASLWYFLDADLPATGGSYPVVATTAAAVDDLHVGVQSFETVNQQPPDAENSTRCKNCDSLSRTVDVFTDGSLVVDVVHTGEERDFAGTNSILKQWESDGGSSSAAGGYKIVPSAGTTTGGWSWATDANRAGYILASFSPMGTPLPAYGAHVDVPFPGDVGNFTGYAWSEHAGWIKLDPTTIPPGELTANPAKIDFTESAAICSDSATSAARYDACGWARACSALADPIGCEGAANPNAAWDGWINFRGLVPVGPVEGLIGWWRFDEEDGLVASDSSGNENDGMLVNMLPTAWDPVGGKIGGGLRFDGTDDFVDLQSPPGSGQWLDVNPEEVTFSVWVLVPAGGLDQCLNKTCRIFSKADGPQLQRHYWTLNTEEVGGANVKLRFRLKLGGNTVTLVGVSADDFPFDQWVHIAATYDGRFMRLYQDGVEIADKRSTSGSIAQDSSVLSWMGNQPPKGHKDDGGQPWNGFIDDARIYERALTLAEIQLLASRPPLQPYSVRWNVATRELEGWAWGDDLIGWVSFNDLSDGGSNHQVVVDLTHPRAEALTRTIQDHCNKTEPAEKLSWTFADDDPAETQTAYRVQVATDPFFTSIVNDTCNPWPGTCAPGFTSQEYIPTGLSYNTAHYWRVTLWDNTNMRTQNEWTVGPSFTTRLHAAPIPSFTYLPEKPTKDEVVEFTDTSVCYNSFNLPYECDTNGSITYQWDFENDGVIDCDGGAACRGDVTHIYTSTGAYTTWLRVTDEIGDGMGSCVNDLGDPAHNLLVSIPFPGWREISPF